MSSPDDDSFVDDEAPLPPGLAREDLPAHSAHLNEPVYARYWNENRARQILQECLPIVPDVADDGSEASDTLCDACVEQLHDIIHSNRIQSSFNVTYRPTVMVEESADLGCCICKLVEKCYTPFDDEFLICLLPVETSDSGFQGFEIVFPDEYESGEDGIRIAITRRLHFQLIMETPWSLVTAFTRYKDIAATYSNGPEPSHTQSEDSQSQTSGYPGKSIGETDRSLDIVFHKNGQQLHRDGNAPDFGRLVNGYSGSRRCIDVLKECIDHCGNHHKTCVSAVTSKLPSRVIDVGVDGREPFLFETGGLDGSYFTLSHCWVQAGIPLESLPATIRDAIILTQDLGIRYIWIDALCVVQDSPEDWETESAKMATIYGECRAMIAASRSSNSTAGIFHDRPKKHGFRIPDRVLETASCPEAILPRAVIHFLDESIVWECLAMRVFESGVYESLASSVTRGSSSLYRNFAGTEFSAAIPDHQWLMLVEEYTRRQLTYESDKIKALSGIATAYGRDRSDFHVNGIWCGNLDQGIMWQAQPRGPRFVGRCTTIEHNYRLDGSTDTKKVTEMMPRVTAGQAGVRRDADLESETDKPTQRTIVSMQLAPSWSWVSVDGPVVWKHGFHIGGVSLLINTHLDPAPTKSYYSRFDCAVLFQAQISRVEYSSDSDNFTAMGEDHQPHEIRGVALEALPDVPEPCYLIWARALQDENKASTDFGCLIVQSNDSPTGGVIECRRIGASWMDADAAALIRQKAMTCDIQLL